MTSDRSNPPAWSFQDSLSVASVALLAACLGCLLGLVVVMSRLVERVKSLEAQVIVVREQKTLERLINEQNADRERAQARRDQSRRAQLHAEEW